jgi:multisubunit Na+/H+ antiporter MnhC subunit
MATQNKSSYDFYLILATVIVLSIISMICVYGMFYFKFAQLQQMAAPVKSAYMERMNQAVSPFIIALIILLAICVPKRLLPTAWLNRFALGLLVAIGAVTWISGVVMALKVALGLTLVLQAVVLVMAVAGNQRLNFAKKGYWLRVGSSCLHLGVILFILDLFFTDRQTLHLALFWVTTVFTVLGMIGCFYSPALAGMMRRGKEGKVSRYHHG